MARRPSIPPSPHPSRPCWTVMVASSHVWVHTLHWAMLFNYLRWGPRWKYIAHISEAKCLGQTRWEIKYTLCHLIWQLSFSSSWIEVVTCTVAAVAVVQCVRGVCSRRRCVYESSWDLALKTNSVNPHTASRPHYSPRRGEKKQHSPYHLIITCVRKPQGLRFCILYK